MQKRGTIQRNWQHRVHCTRRRKTKENTIQYVLDTTMSKQTQITLIRHIPSYKNHEIMIQQLRFYEESTNLSSLTICLFV